MLKMVSDCGDIVGSSKAAGESPSVMSTDTMALAVSSNYGDAACEYDLCWLLAVGEDSVF